MSAPLPVFLRTSRSPRISQTPRSRSKTPAENQVSAPLHIVEVGAGYGRFAYAMLSKYPQVKYTIIDIEPALTISRWYLGELFPEDRLTFLNAAQSSDLRPADLAVSISSLQEMTPQQVQFYLKLFGERVTGTVYLKQWTRWTNPVDSGDHDI